MEYQTHTPAKGKKLNRYLGFGYMLAGAFFLFEPYIGIIDLLPDALGYLLICLGLYRLADLDERLSEALKGARSLALVGIARWVAMFLVFGFVSPAEQPVFMLLMLFSLGVLDCILLIPMWKHLGGGLQYLGARSDATAMLDRKKMNGKQGTYNVVEKYTAVTTVFFVLHELLAILPELTVLTHEKGGAELGQGTRYYDFVGLFRGIGILHVPSVFGVSAVRGEKLLELIVTFKYENVTYALLICCDSGTHARRASAYNNEIRHFISSLVFP